jgi:glyoxylase-like metal-dependent hydrolase (beta-lactamase superfamily II)
LLDVEVTPLKLATMELPDFHPEAPGLDTVYGFLVRDQDSCVLIDTGVGSGSELIDGLYKPDRVELSSALAAAGASRSDITGIVNSHLHFDHCGNNPAFPGVPIYVQEAELEAAKQPHYTVSEWVSFPDARYVSVKGVHSISSRLELHPTPGHTPGHQSLVIRSGPHIDLIVAQAAYTAHEFRAFQGAGLSLPGEMDSTLQAYMQSNATWSKSAYASSLGWLHGWKARRAFFSHDPTVWTRAV